ncbi:ATP-dependent DNA helicase PIF1, partial [Trachymyrmex cornetzi]
DILSSIRMDLITDPDINIFQSRKIQFKGSSCDERLNELCTYMNQLPVDTICLLSTCYLCKVLNTEMLDKIDGNETLLMVEDDVDRAAAMKKKFSDGQAYVGLSRVSTLEGLHLINFNPASVKANSGAIVEYNRLRSVFKAQLPQINLSEKKAVKIYDCRWALPNIIDDV